MCVDHLSRRRFLQLSAVSAAALTSTEGAASARVLENVGMTHEGRATANIHCIPYRYRPLVADWLVDQLRAP